MSAADQPTAPVLALIILFAIVDVAILSYAWGTCNESKGIRHELDP